MFFWPKQHPCWPLQRSSARPGALQRLGGLVLGRQVFVRRAAAQGAGLVDLEKRQVTVTTIQARQKKEGPRFC